MSSRTDWHTTVSIRKVARGDRHAEATLRRWPEWKRRCHVHLYRFGLGWRPGIWIAVWHGPLGGRYAFVALTRRAAIRRVRRELRRWDKKRLRVDGRP